MKNAQIVMTSLDKTWKQIEQTDGMLGLTILENTNAKRIKKALTTFLNSETRTTALKNITMLKIAVKKYNQYNSREDYAIRAFLDTEEKYIECAYVIGLGETCKEYETYKFNIVARDSEEIGNMRKAWYPVMLATIAATKAR